MIGLEIRINDEDPITVASDNLVFVNLLHGYSSDRIMVMHQGRLTGKLEAEEIAGNKEIQQTVLEMASN